MQWVIRAERASPSLNQYTYAMSPFTQARDKQDWAMLIRAAQGFLECPRATGKRKLTIERHGVRALDQDNLIGGAKCVIIDNLRAYGLLLDDTAAALELDAKNIRLQPGEPPHTVLIIEDAGGINAK